MLVSAAIAGCGLDTLGIGAGDAGTVAATSTGASSATAGTTTGLSGPTEDLPAASTSAGESTTGPAAACGDGRVDPGEVCDDGDLDAFDGCQASCTPTQAVKLYGGGYSSFTCATMYSGDSARCWGNNAYGQLGYDFFDPMAGAADHAIGDVPAELPQDDAVWFPGQIVEFAPGDDHNCVLLGDGHVYCWGASELGLLGLGKSFDPPTVLWDSEDPGMRRVPLAATALHIGSGRHGTCAILAGGTLQCWGRNQAGQVGDGTLDVIGDDEAPVVVAFAPDVQIVQVVGGEGHTCVRTQLGAVWCWGAGDRGQLGNGDVAPVLAPGDGKVVALGLDTTAIAAGYAHTCAIHAFGAVRCWGANSYGQLGRGNGFDQGGTPQTIPDNTGHDVDLGDGEVAAQVVCGAEHTCARTSQGDVFCWGRGEQGQLGHEDLENFGDEIGESPAGRGPVELGEAAVELSVGAYHTCALLVSGAVRCWGRSNLGQLGQGSVANIGDQRGSMPPPDVPYF